MALERKVVLVWMWENQETHNVFDPVKMELHNCTQSKIFSSTNAFNLDQTKVQSRLKGESCFSQIIKNCMLHDKKPVSHSELTHYQMTKF